MPDDVALVIEKLRGDMATGFARLEGRLDLIAQSQDRTVKDLEDLDARVTALEARRVPLGTLAATSGAVSAVVAALAVFIR